MSTNAILAQVFVGTHYCPHMVRDREDCAGVSPRRLNRAASHAHALMHDGGNVCTPGGHFFTFADERGEDHSTLSLVYFIVGAYMVNTNRFKNDMTV